MDKTIGYYLERFSGVIVGVISVFLFYKYWYSGSAITVEKYYDLIIKVCSTLFGFLLTLLGLIVNSSSAAVTEMRSHSSYQTLISYHKTAISLTFGLLLFSILMYLIISPSYGVEGFNYRFGLTAFKVITSIHSGISIWTLINITLFVRIFYKIVLSKSN